MGKVRPAGWWLDGLLVAGFVALTVALAQRSSLLRLDLAVRDLADAHRPDWAYLTARVFNYLGQGGQVLLPLALLAAGWMARRKHSVRPLLPVIGAFVVTYLTIGPLKLWADRLAASNKEDPHPELLFHDPVGMSYPSGHVVNAIVWYGVLAILLASTISANQRRVVRYLAPAIVLFTTTYLSFHWMTDGIAAIMLGVLLDRLLRRVPWDTVPLGRRLTKWGWAGPADLGEPERDTA